VIEFKGIALFDLLVHVKVAYWIVGDLNDPKTRVLKVVSLPDEVIDFF